MCRQPSKPVEIRRNPSIVYVCYLQAMVELAIKLLWFKFFWSDKKMSQFSSKQRCDSKVSSIFAHLVVWTMPPRAGNAHSDLDASAFSDTWFYVCVMAYSNLYTLCASLNKSDDRICYIHICDDWPATGQEMVRAIDQDIADGLDGLTATQMELVRARMCLCSAEGRTHTCGKVLSIWCEIVRLQEPALICVVLFWCVCPYVH